MLATSTSDAQGIARFTGLPDPDRAGTCGGDDRFNAFDGLDFQDYYAAPALTRLMAAFVIAETTGDLSFVHSSRQRGIEPWRFNPPSERWDAPDLHRARPRHLFRAGDTVHEACPARPDAGRLGRWPTPSAR
ncbi:MAG: hypothetical protein U0802_24200 [Candidatus Binatia bacterium]